MKLLEGYVSSDIINRVEDLYDKKTLFNIMEREQNAKNILDYFKELGLDLASIVLNRLDLLLVDYNYLKKNINDYEQDVIVPVLIDDISNLDYK